MSSSPYTAPQAPLGGSCIEPQGVHPHLVVVAGIWGTLAVCIAGGGNFGVQLLGVGAVGAFVFGASWLLWRILAMTLGIRVSARVERLGQDVGELGIEAYPEFVLMPEEYDDDETSE